MRSLDAICETFAPGAVEQGVPAAVLDALEHDLTAGSGSGCSCSCAPGCRGSRGSPSRVARQSCAVARQPGAADAHGFQALRKAALAFAYMLPGRWEQIGYPGPLGPHETRRRRGSSRSTIGAGLELECDVCVDRLGRRRGRRRGRARRGRARRRRARGGRLLVGARLRRRRASGFRRLYRGGGAAATDDQGVGADRGRLPRRRHGRQLHDLVPDARRRAGRVGGARLPVGRDFGAEPGRRLRAARRQHRPQPPVASRRGAAARARDAGLARRRDAAERARLRAGRRLRLLRLRLPARREAVDDADVARGRGGAPARGSSSARRRGACSSSDGARRRRRRRAGAGARTSGRRGRGGDRDARAAAPLRADEPEHRPLAPAAPGDGRLRASSTRRSGRGRGRLQALYSDQHRGSRRRLRGQVRDRAGPSGAADRRAAVGRRRASTRG